MKRYLLITILCIHFLPLAMFCSENSDACFTRIIEIQEELKVWEDQLKAIVKQKNKGKVSKAYLTMLNGVLSQIQLLRKESLVVLEQIRQEEEKTLKEKEEVQYAIKKG